MSDDGKNGRNSNDLEENSEPVDPRWGTAQDPRWLVDPNKLPALNEDPAAYSSKRLTTEELKAQEAEKVVAGRALKLKTVRGMQRNINPKFANVMTNHRVLMRYPNSSCATDCGVFCPAGNSAY